MTATRFDFNTPTMRRKRSWRKWKDKLAVGYIRIGGIAVLAAITLIFFYLAWVVMPLFQGAEMQQQAQYSPSWRGTGNPPLLLSVEEQNEVAMRLDANGKIHFFAVADGNLITEAALPLPPGTRITSIARDQPDSRLAAVGLSDGRVILFQPKFLSSYPDGKRVITPSLEYPFGEEPILLDSTEHAVTNLAINYRDGNLLLAAENDGNLRALQLAREENPFTGETSVDQKNIPLPLSEYDDPILLLESQQRWLYVAEKNFVDVFDLRTGKLNGHYPVGSSNDHDTITAISPLLGGVSLLIGQGNGIISQWFMIRDAQGASVLTHIRSFQLDKTVPIRQIEAEQRRKGFVALDDSGRLGVFHSTAHRTLLRQDLPQGTRTIALSPRANLLLTESPQGFNVQDLDNPHPEISWSALWGKVWYENYEKPDYIWQSTSANCDFEPKLSLTPLTFGTLKAAFYAMLLAAPLAIAAAIYTAYFMAPRLRSSVKPVIELMQALPTVILGFFAGIFLAPYLEYHLPGIFCLLIFLPIGILAAGYLWSRMPSALRHRMGEGWELIILIPVVILIGILSFAFSGHMENLLFGGDMRLWLTDRMEIPFDQRNALIVGIAMGFAVIPNIFSIAEDAVFSVPKSLTLGSLALGATPWQTMTRVVILTASPGIFSALMIGLGRAVGETMIVLMATGNTPIMDINLFEGLRTLSANVAVEMPEAEVSSSHYRLLFLSSLVLLLFTFIMNTLAESVRHRLRKKYASL